MEHRMLRIFTMLVLSFAAAQAISLAEGHHRLEGTWNVNVTVRNCQSGALVRSVRSLNLFMHDGAMSETAANIMRTNSLGTWTHDHANVYTATFWFFRYNPDGSFASRAKVTRTIDVNPDGDQFTSTGTVEDVDANDVLISTSCATETASRLQ